MMPTLFAGASILPGQWARIMVWYLLCNVPKGGVVSFLSMLTKCDWDSLSGALKDDNLATIKACLFFDPSITTF
jgi:hypothetical protein